MKRALLVLLVVFVGCKDKKSRHHGDDDEGGCKVTAEKPADTVTGKTPGMIAPFEAIKLGMSAADAKAACPNLFKEQTKTGAFDVSEIVGKFGKTYVHGRLRFQDDKLVQVELTEPAEIADALTAAWGAPEKSSGKEPSLVWHDAATHTRAMLQRYDTEADQLAISSYVPLEAFVEQDPKTIAFKPDAVLGKTPAELLKAFPQYVRPSTTSEEVKKQSAAMMSDLDKDLAAKGIKVNKAKPAGPEADVSLPQTPDGSDRTTAVLHVDNDTGKVRSYAVWFRTGDLMHDASWPGEIDAIVKLFDKLWGAHKVMKDVLGENTVWTDPVLGIRAEARLDKPGQLDVEYVRYLPLAKLFGAPGEVWGFEKPDRPLLGATADELKAAYGDAIEVKDADTATLHLPTTDYDDAVARTTILMFIRDGKVEEWTLNLPYRMYEPARDEYGKLLEAKYGAGKPGERDHVRFGAGVDASYSDITHALDLDVTAGGKK